MVLRLPDVSGAFSDVESLVSIGRVDAAAAGSADIAVATLTAHIDAAVKALMGTPAQPPAPWPVGVLLDLQVPELFGADWEGAFRRLGFAGSVLRFRDVSDERVLLPFRMPARVLQVAPQEAAPFLPSDGATRYFRLHRLNGIVDDDLSTTLRAGHYEVVHLLVSGRWGPGGSGELTVRSPMLPEADWLGAADVLRPLDACGARLLLLQCALPADYPITLDVAHRLQRAGGPTTVVVEAAAQPACDGFYMSIVHDQSIDMAAQSSLPAPMRSAVFLAVGGADVLKISPHAEELLRRAQRSERVAKRLSHVLHPPVAAAVGFRAPPPAPPVAAPAPAEPSAGAAAQAPPAGDVDITTARDLSDLVMESSQELVSRLYNYRSESGAWMPLQIDQRRFDATLRDIETLQRRLDRVVNVGVADADGPLSRQRPLRPRQECELTVQIGRRALWSVVDGDAAFPDAALRREFKDDGVALRVVVFAPSFEVPEPDATLVLPRPPAESDTLRIAMRAPGKPARHRLRLGLYYEHNLVQSFIVRVSVVANGRRAAGPQGPQAEVEYALSATLLDVADLPKRSFNFLANATDDGTHTLAIVGQGNLRESFDFGEGEMRAAVDAARRALFEVAADMKTKPPTYRFDVNNRTHVKRLEQDLIPLAGLGWELYTQLVTGKNHAFADALRKALGASGAQIQVSAVKSARYVFPWALVYDHPVVEGGNALCPVFSKDLANVAAGAPLAKSKCLTDGCPHVGDTAIVCPSGFWGFKHLIEQPLSVSTESDATGKTDHVLEIRVPASAAGAAPSALMAVSRELDQVTAHTNEINALPASFKFEIRDKKTEIGLLMKEAALRMTGLVYFYCHGGRDRSRSFLGIGRQERLLAADLNAWGLDWADVHPLVIINGCHTADLTPDDLMTFNRAFAWAKAAGVLGTEIDMPEALARHFAKGFVPAFAGGAKVGEALRAQRLALLERCNLLGLAYTAYCSSDLRLVRH